MLVLDVVVVVAVGGLYEIVNCCGETIAGAVVEDMTIQMSAEASLLSVHMDMDERRPRRIQITVASPSARPTSEGRARS